jgi:hypothetical protein
MQYTLMHKPQAVVMPADGTIAVTQGCVWLTRHGDWQDHVVSAGHSIALSRGDQVVMESWRRDAPALWDWRPAQVGPWSRRKHYRALVLHAVARFLGAGAAALAALARNAAAMASRAQGCISAGDSTASSGAVQ